MDTEFSGYCTLFNNLIYTRFLSVIELLVHPHSKSREQHPGRG